MFYKYNTWRTEAKKAFRKLEIIREFGVIDEDEDEGNVIIERPPTPPIATLIEEARTKWTKDESNQRAIMSEMFHLSMNFEKLAGRKDGAIKELKDVGFTGSVDPLFNFLGKGEEKGSKRNSLCIQCKVRESRTKHSRCPDCIQGE